MGILTGLGFIILPLAGLAAIDWLFAGRRKAKVEASRQSRAGADGATNYSLIESRSNQTRNSGPFM